MIAVIPRRAFTWTGAAMEARAWPVSEPALAWMPCPTCWGQRREWAQGSEGGWYWRACVGCLGLGDVPAVKL